MRLNLKELPILQIVAQIDQKIPIKDVPFHCRVDKFAKVPLITPKFYSSHDVKEILSSDPKLYNELKKQQEIGPKEKYEQPLLESHKYGWFSEPLIKTDPTDRRLNFKRAMSDVVKIKTYIDSQDRALKGHV